MFKRTKIKKFVRKMIEIREVSRIEKFAEKLKLYQNKSL